MWCDEAHNHPLHSEANFAIVFITHAAGRCDLGRGNPKRGVLKRVYGPGGVKQGGVEPRVVSAAMGIGAV